MAGITLAHAQAQLDKWLAANEAAATNQSYTIGDRTLTRADAKTILAQIDYWDAKVKQLTPGSSPIRRFDGVIYK